MNLNSLFEGAIDELEKRRIEDLEMKMDDLAARAKESKDPKVIAALRQEFAKAKAERDSYHYVNEHGGGGGGPEQWHAYVKSHRANEAANPAQQAAIAIAKKKEQGVDEGWSNKMVARRTGQALTPYSVYISGKEWKSFPDDDHAENVANKLRAKFEAEGRDPSVITIAPTGYDEDVEESWSINPEHLKGPRSMKSAAAKPTGPKFGGYLKGTDPAPNEYTNKGVGGCEESIENEGAKVDRMVKHIAKSERDLGKSKKDAEAIAWATANKRGMLDNANKKDESVDNSHETNFLSWVLNQGKRFQGFTANPETYAKAKEAYKKEHGAEATFSEGMSNALSNITRRIAQPVNANKIIKNREQKKDSLKRQHFAEDEITEMFGPELQAMGGLSGLLKDHGIPLMAFAAVAAMYGISQAAEQLEQGESKFKKLVAKAVNSLDKNVIHKMAAKLHDVALAEEKQKGVDGKACWDGYKRMGTKQKGGKTVDNCVKMEEDWQKTNKKDKTDGMSQKAVNAYRRENPGSKLKTAVTTPPSKLKKGSKDSKRRKSYCARSAGQKKMHNIDCSKTPDKAICKARKRWNCESQEQFDAMLREAVEKSELQPGQFYVWTVYFDDGTNKRVKVTKDTFDPKAYYAKQNKVVVNVDYDWTPKNG